MEVQDQSDRVEPSRGNGTNGEVIARVLLGHSFVDLVDIDGAADTYDEECAFNEKNDSVEECAVDLPLEVVSDPSAAATTAEEEDDQD